MPLCLCQGARHSYRTLTALSVSRHEGSMDKNLVSCSSLGWWAAAGCLIWRGTGESHSSLREASCVASRGIACISIPFCRPTTSVYCSVALTPFGPPICVSTQYEAPSTGYKLFTGFCHLMGHRSITLHLARQVHQPRMLQTCKHTKTMKSAMSPPRKTSDSYRCGETYEGRLLEAVWQYPRSHASQTVRVSSCL